MQYLSYDRQISRRVSIITNVANPTLIPLLLHENYLKAYKLQLMILEFGSKFITRE